MGRVASVQSQSVETAGKVSASGLTQKEVAWSLTPIKVIGADDDHFRQAMPWNKRVPLRLSWLTLCNESDKRRDDRKRGDYHNGIKTQLPLSYRSENA